MGNGSRSRVWVGFPGTKHGSWNQAAYIPGLPVLLPCSVTLGKLLPVGASVFSSANRAGLWALREELRGEKPGCPVGANGSLLAPVPGGVGKVCSLSRLSPHHPQAAGGEEGGTLLPGRVKQQAPRLQGLASELHRRAGAPGSDARVRARIGQERSSGAPGPGQGYLETPTILRNLAAESERRGRRNQQ